MGQTYAYEALARAFHEEGTEALFTLLGDANLHFGITLGALPGVRTYHVRHEHVACMMALGYAMTTGRVGVASVTAGPGLTQTLTALATAVAARAPVVVLTGETPLGSAWSNQRIDQKALVTSVGARYIASHSPSRMLDDVSEAFYVAQFERVPVVLGVPYDLQKRAWQGEWKYRPSRDYIPQAGLLHPDPASVVAVADAIGRAERPILIGGRGAARGAAVEACEKLAAASGALLANTLPVQGMFDHDPFSVRLAGGFSDARARAFFAESDLVIAVGASLTQLTVDSGHLFPQAKVVQIDAEPLGRRHGLKAADLYVRADAKVGVEALLAELARRPVVKGWRSPAVAKRIADFAGDEDVFDIPAGQVDPRRAIAALDDLVPKDWEVVGSAGHCSYFYSHMRGRGPHHFHVCREFGAIGNALGYAMGVAAARPQSPVVLIEGDGSFLMHAQELETIRRHGLNMLICVLNDGGFGAEFHKLRADGLDDAPAIFGRGDLASMARGFGLRGETIGADAEIAPAFARHAAARGGCVWDIHISDRVPVPKFRKAQQSKAE